MILGFGNNVVSSLASDITASQTTFSVLPGDGPLFAALLTSDFSNKSTTLKNYAKITLTDSGETAFEVCHLTAVNGDTLTVIRGQEGTTAKGWALKDVVANFATRGSENSFPQIAHIQSGFYTSGTAGGTANALTLELPTTFFLNGSVDWVLKTPLVVYPSQNNTGAATLQLTMGGRVLGTFKLYKGNKAELVANDILKDVALVCLLDNTKTFFNVANPGAIYAGLGTAAFKDIVTSMTDISTGRIPVVGWMGLGGVRDTKLADENFASFWRDTSIVKSGITIPYDGSPTVSYFAVDGANQHAYIGRKQPGGTISWVRIYSEFNKPTASDTGALPVFTNNLSVDLNTLGNMNSRGIYCQGANANATAANHYPIQQAGSLYCTPSAYGCQQMYVSYANRIFIRGLTGTYTGTGPWSEWVEMYGPNHKPTAGDVGALPITGGTVTGNTVVNGTLGVGNGRKFEIISQNSSTLSGALLLWGNTDRPTVFEFKDGSGYHFYSQRNKDGSISLVVNGGMSLTNWSNFDARYQPKGNYTPAGQAYTKAESDARYVQNIRLGAVESSNTWAEKSPYVVTGSDKVVGDDYVGHAVRRPLQKLVNGTWINAGW